MDPRALIKKEELLGKTFLTQRGFVIEIIEYINSMKVKVRFEDGGETYTTLSSILKGFVRNKNERNRYGVGYVGWGKYKTKFEGKDSKCYTTWVNMLDRCYNPKNTSRAPAYVGVTVCDEWHCFQNFAEWYGNNYITGWELDKDLIGNGKLYSESNCTFLPPEINLNLGIFKGITKLENGKFLAQIRNENKHVKLGVFVTEEEAVACYKEAKAKKLKHLTEKYRENITESAYTCMIQHIELNFNCFYREV